MSSSKAESAYFIKPLPPIRSPGNAASARGAEILQAMNDDVRELNRLISEYNRAADNRERINKLQQLDQVRQRLDDVYPDNIVALVPDYQSCMYTFLPQAISQQRTKLHVDSNYKLRAAFEPDLGRELSNVLQSLSSEEIAQIMQILASQDRKNIRQRLASVAAMNSDYQTFLIQHDVSVVGDGNSKNFVFVNRISQQRIFLKLENRLDQPKKADRELRAAQRPASKFLIREWSDRRAVFRDPNTNQVTVRRLVVMDCSSGRTLHDMPVQTSIAEHQAQAVDMALAQIILYQKMHMLGKTWSDGKGSNIFLHRDPTTKCMMAEIADCKAIYPCDPVNRTANFASNPIWTKGMTAPELLRKTPGLVSMEQATIYTIGKNLYESLLLFEPKVYQKYLKRDKNDNSLSDTIELSNAYFKHAIFAEPFQSLIQHMTCADPAARISTEDLFTQLLDIKFAQHPDRIQYQEICHKLKQVSGFALDDEEKLKRNEFVLKCYEHVLLPNPDLTKLDQRLSRVIQKYSEISSTTIYKEALDTQKNVDHPTTSHRKGIES